MNIRSYERADEAACLTVLTSNTPEFFTVGDRRDFATFLRTTTDPYFELEVGGHVVACGGAFVRRDGHTAGLSWGMVERAQHRVGYGRALLAARLDWLREFVPVVDSVSIETSQRSAGFFRHLGFETTTIQHDFYAPGLHRYEMRRPLLRDDR